MVVGASFGLHRASSVIQPMAVRTRTSSGFDLAEVTFHWAGGRNVVWRMTHEPTGICVEGATQLTEQNFTKKRLRMAEETLKAKLLNDLERRVSRAPAAIDEAG